MTSVKQTRYKEFSSEIFFPSIITFKVVFVQLTSGKWQMVTGRSIKSSGVAHVKYSKSMLVHAAQIVLLRIKQPHWSIPGPDPNVRWQTLLECYAWLTGLRSVVSGAHLQAFSIQCFVTNPHSDMWWLFRTKKSPPNRSRWIACVQILTISFTLREIVTSTHSLLLNGILYIQEDCKGCVAQWPR